MYELLWWSKDEADLYSPGPGIIDDLYFLKCEMGGPKIAEGRRLSVDGRWTTAADLSIIVESPRKHKISDLQLNSSPGLLDVFAFSFQSDKPCECLEHSKDRLTHFS